MGSHYPSTDPFRPENAKRARTDLEEISRDIYEAKVRGEDVTELVYEAAMAQEAK